MTKGKNFMTTKSQAVAADVAALLRARNPFLFVVTKEEQRVERYLFEAAKSAGYIPRTWDVAQGVCELNGDKAPFGSADPDDTLNVIKERTDRKERGVWIMRDLPPLLKGAVTNRLLRNLARTLPGVPRESAQAVIVIWTTADIPPELAPHATVIDWPLPDRDEVAAILDAAVEAGGDKVEPLTNGTRDQAIDAAVGLTGEEAQACYAKSLVTGKRIDPVG